MLFLFWRYMFPKMAYTDLYDQYLPISLVYNRCQCNLLKMSLSSSYAFLSFSHSPKPISFLRSYRGMSMGCRGYPLILLLMFCFSPILEGCRYCLQILTAVPRLIASDIYRSQVFIMKKVCLL